MVNRLKWFNRNIQGYDSKRRKANMLYILEQLEENTGISIDTLLYKLAFKTNICITTLKEHLKILLYSGETPFYIDDEGIIKRNKRKKELEK